MFSKSNFEEKDEGSQGEENLMSNRFCRRLAKSVNGYALLCALVMSRTRSWRISSKPAFMRAAPRCRTHDYTWPGCIDSKTGVPSELCTHASLAFTAPHSIPPAWVGSCGEQRKNLCGQRCQFYREGGKHKKLTNTEIFMPLEFRP